MMRTIVPGEAGYSGSHGMSNTGRNRETGVLGLAGIIRDLAESPYKIGHVSFRCVWGDESDEIPRRVPDAGRSVEALDFQAQAPLEVGPRDSVDWFRQSSPSRSRGMDPLTGAIDQSHTVLGLGQRPDSDIHPSLDGDC